MPSLHHQASNSIIDLTEDDVPSSQGRRSSQRAGAPPQLARSDSITLGAEVIEIDDSDDDEVEFLRETRLPPPPPQPRPRSVHHPVAYRNQLPPPNVRPDNRNDMMAAFREVQRNIGLMNQGNNVGALFGHRHLNNIGNNIRGLFGEIRPPGDNIPMRMPGNMDYHLHPFQEPAQQAKDEHVPPPPAREGFTRSPKEDDICVCPACDEELVFHPDQVESTSAVKPSSKKAPSKADRAEHPFWVVRECGHVSRPLAFIFVMTVH